MNRCYQIGNIKTRVYVLFFLLVVALGSCSGVVTGREPKKTGGLRVGWQGNQSEVA
ncbi:MAG: hypothetical protein KIB42_07150 [Varibaculum cambriense]|uniref:hypothetical protein n=1 Tax=Varibaculum cambriense TaxID=184870 RepID=UPI001ED7163D|nr:hypothetical protein [Varibaculum cambriense]MBS5919389.1 hypothetical protein [Varibaculum cambriense]